MSTLRFYLTGRVAVEGARVLDQAALPGRQGRLALVYLVARRHRPVPVGELATALWGEELPRSWEPSVRVVVSKLRTVLDDAGHPGPTITTDGGCYQLRVTHAWVDTEAAINALDRAEGAWRHDDTAATWSDAVVAAGILRRPLLPGEDLPWVDALRARLHAASIRAMDLLVRVHLERAEYPLAVAVGRDLVALEPFREASYRHLMGAHLAAGDRAEAIRVHQVLRDLLAEELGVDPSEATTALYLEILRSGARVPPGDAR